MAIALALILTSFCVVAMAIMIAVLAHRLRQQDDEIIELQAVADLIMISHGKPPIFAPRFDLDLERLDDDDD